MKKCQLILIFLMSYNFLKMIECHHGRAIRGLKLARQINFNLTAVVTPEPITKSIIDDFRDQYKIGIINDSILRNDTRNLFKEILKNKSPDLMDLLDENFDRIDEFYIPFNELLKSRNEVNFSELGKFFNVVLSDGANGVKYALKQMEITVKKILDTINSIDESKKDSKSRFCGSEPVLRQENVFQFLKVIVNKTFSGHYLIISAAKFITRSGKAGYLSKMQEMVEVARREILSYTNLVRNAMEKTSRDMGSCNYDVDIKNKTYLELTGPSQGFIFESSEVDERYSCQSFNGQPDHCGPRDPLCFLHTCSADGGVLQNCETISTNTMAICLSGDPSKRYLSAESNSQIYGNQSAAKHCPLNYIKRQVTLKKWKKGDVRAISFDWASADIQSNRVVTNLRFREKNGMISLVPQTGVLLPGGLIDQKTLRWILPFTQEPIITEDKLSYYYPADKRNPLSGQTLHAGKNFMQITSGLSINLDDITVPSKHVITGVRLNKAQSPEDVNENVIELVVKSTEFDFKTGQLINLNETELSGTTFMTAEFAQTKRQKINLGETNTPISKPGENTVISEPYQQLEFRQTSKNDDLGQSFVPFIDIRGANTKVAMPLSTVSLFHRGCAESGGFIAFKYQSFDISEYFDNFIDLALFVDETSHSNFYHSLIE
ncbi:uncharacterized protein LOC122854009 [Aphidius gifuensis]|uniref:uncharacterized protein LOC122854009 n=1 Tax=Aphidius gifuensis TaxID=684658 RepID=UPI001CDD273A|nr:uncharacterized protein LOC122854009 [Aphidius gifuensis]